MNTGVDTAKWAEVSRNTETTTTMNVSVNTDKNGDLDMDLDSNADSGVGNNDDMDTQQSTDKNTDLTVNTALGLYTHGMDQSNTDTDTNTNSIPTSRHVTPSTSLNPMAVQSDITAPKKRRARTDLKFKQKAEIVNALVREGWDLKREGVVNMKKAVVKATVKQLTARYGIVDRTVKNVMQQERTRR